MPLFAALKSRWPNWPLPVWMILISLLLGILANQSPGEVVRIFNDGWGYAVGEFALILIPSFTLAAVIEKRNMAGAPWLSVSLAPLPGPPRFARTPAMRRCHR